MALDRLRRVAVSLGTFGPRVGVEAARSLPRNSGCRWEQRLHNLSRLGRRCHVGTRPAESARSPRRSFQSSSIYDKQLARFEGHRGAITALRFSTDGRTLISGSADSTALVWEVKRKK